MEEDLRTKLTKDAIEEYIHQSKYSKVACPFCNSPDVYRILDSDYETYGLYFLDRKCNNCGKMWREEYSISTIEELVWK